MSSSINNGDPLPDLILQNNSGVAVGELAPLSDWSAVGELEHFVQFYDTDTFLLDSLVGFIGTGLKRGDAGIIIATATHLAAIDERLAASGVDVAAARALGQYVTLDAAETLSKLLVDGAPDHQLFRELVSGVISRASEGRSAVRIFGEMVALLWAEGKYSEAIQLEEFWNELRGTHSFSLLCGYPLGGFSGETMTDPLHKVCASHSSVIPTESYTNLGSTDDRLRVIIELQQKARRLEVEIEQRKAKEAELRSVLEEREKLLVREQLARAEAESANRLKDEFLATVSHELRTPLTAIIGWSNMLSEQRLNGEAAARALKTIERNAKVQAQLVEDILDVSRFITGNLRLNVAQVDAASIINAAIDSVQLAADSKGIQLEVRLDPKARHIQGDAGRLQQVVWNLLSNAIKFTPAGGQVRVRLERAGSCVQIKVSDTGQGIGQDFLPFIFDRFRQADGSSTRRQGGLGLGLAIVRHLVELHGGTVKAESPGHGLGATFTLSLPLAAQQTHEGQFGRRGVSHLRTNMEQDAKPCPVSSLEGVSVLLVDDDSDTLNLLAVILSDCKATVQKARTTEEALSIFEWYRPDVLVSDIAMPVEDGYSLISRVRQMEDETNRKPAQAIALTAYARVEDRARALSAGFNMFVPKPVEPNELITAIAGLIEQDADSF